MFWGLLKHSSWQICRVFSPLNSITTLGGVDFIDIIVINTIINIIITIIIIINIIIFNIIIFYIAYVPSISRVNTKRCNPQLSNRVSIEDHIYCLSTKFRHSCRLRKPGPANKPNRFKTNKVGDSSTNIRLKQRKYAREDVNNTEERHQIYNRATEESSNTTADPDITYLTGHQLQPQHTASELYSPQCNKLHSTPDC